MNHKLTKLRIQSLAIVVVTAVTASVSAQGPLAHEANDTPSSAGRIALQVGAGVLGAGVAWTPHLFERASCTECADIPAFFPSLALVPVTTSMAVYFAGEAAGGNSSYWSTLIGSTAGMGVAAVIILVKVSIAIRDIDLDLSDLFNDWNDPAMPEPLPEQEEPDMFSDGLWCVAFSVAPVIGALIGYELVNRPPPSEPAPSSPRVQLVPEIIPTSDLSGATVGLSGRF